MERISIYISTCNLRGLICRVWRREDFREIAFIQIKKQKSHGSVPSIGDAKLIK